MADASQLMSVSVSAFDSVLDASPDAVLALTVDGGITAGNAAAARLFGLSKEGLAGAAVVRLLPEGFDAASVRTQLTANPAGHPLFLDVMAVHENGTAFSAEVACALHPGGHDDGSGVVPDPTQAGLLVSIRGTAHRAPQNLDTGAATSLLTATLEATADGIVVLSNDDKVVGYNENFLTMWGIPRALMAVEDQNPIMQLSLAQVTDPEGFARRLVEVRLTPDEESKDVVHFRDGRTYERYSRPHRVGQAIAGRVWSFRDVTPRQKAQELAKKFMRDLAKQTETLRAMAFQDPLTGLDNRAVFNEALSVAMREPRSTSVDVLLLDLDDFKEVNDILGHQAGDELLVEVARRLRDCAFGAEVVARLGGDEFVVLLAANPTAHHIAASIVESLNVPFTINGTVLRLSLSLGLASMTADSRGPSELLRQADIAMYAAKAAGKNRFLRFHQDMMTALVRRTHMENGLRLAVACGEISVDYQPIVSHRTGQVVQFEALARWDRSAERVPPSVFIPLAERTGLISEIGAAVMKLSLTQLAPWLRKKPSRSLAVNVSAVQLQDPGFADMVLAMAKSSRVAPSQLVLEVTESVFFEDDCTMIGQLSILRSAGTRVALDDFGTGYSSLGRLQDLPVDTVKVDRSFVSMIQTGREFLPILSSMINMAHSLGLTVTAEGVETAAQADYLTALHCDSLQGYLFSQPVPGSQLRRALQNSGDALIELNERVKAQRGA